MKRFSMFFFFLLFTSNGAYAEQADHLAAVIESDKPFVQGYFHYLRSDTPQPANGVIYQEEQLAYSKEGKYRIVYHQKRRNNPLATWQEVFDNVQCFTAEADNIKNISITQDSRTPDDRNHAFLQTYGPGPTFLQGHGLSHLVDMAVVGEKNGVITITGKTYRGTSVIASVDSKKGYVLQNACESLSEGKLVFEYRYSQPIEIAPHVWVPTSVVRELIKHPLGIEDIKITYQLLDADVKKPDEQLFHIALGQGTKIFDSRFGNTAMFHKTSAGSISPDALRAHTLAFLEAQAKIKARGERIHEGKQMQSYLFNAVVAVMVASVVGFIGYFSKMKRK